MKGLFRVTDWERVSWWRRTLGALARVVATLVVLDILISLLGPPIGIFFSARLMAHKVPALWQTPKPQADRSISSAPGATFAYFGYQFEVPWNSAFQTRRSKQEENAPAKGGMVQILFDSGQSVLFIVPIDQKGLLTEIVEDPSLSFQSSRVLLGSLIDASPYDQYSALLNTTPSSIRAFGPRAEAVRGMVLLTFKGIAPPGNLESGLFSFEWPGKRGFQIGDPQKPGSVALEVLDMQGRWVEIICGDRRNGVKLTQPELNRILATLRVQPPDLAASQQAGPKATVKPIRISR